jgi:hypothetical protein
MSKRCKHQNITISEMLECSDDTEVVNGRVVSRGAVEIFTPTFETRVFCRDCNRWFRFGAGNMPSWVERHLTPDAPDASTAPVI